MADKVRIDITASDKTEASAESAKKNIRGLKDAAEEAGSKGASAIGRLTKGMSAAGSAASKAQEIIGKALIPAAAVAAVAGLVNKWREVRAEVARTREELTRTADDFQKKTQKLALTVREVPDFQLRLLELMEQAQAEQQKINAAVEAERDKRGNLFAQTTRLLFTRTTVAKLEKEAAANVDRITAGLKQQIGLIKRQADVERERSEAEKDRQRNASTDRELTQARLDSLSEEDRVASDLEQKRADLNERLREADSEEEKEKIRELWQFYFDEAGRTLDKIKKRKQDDADEQARRDRENADRQHRENLQQIEREKQARLDAARALQSLQQSQRFGDSNTSVLGGRTVNVKQGGDFTRSIR